MPARRESAQKRIDLTFASDQMLIELTREGVGEAFGELWSRHNCSAIGAARAFTNFDPNDLMQEAFLRVYASVMNGGTVPISFRAYIATTVRNLARDKGRKEPGEFVSSYEDENGNEAIPEEDFSERVLADSTTARAFRELPSRFREVLWYRDVEDLPVQEVARYLGMSPNSATVTIKRARNAFKTAWIKAQLSPARNLPKECEVVVERIASYSRGKLSATETAKIDLHVLECVHCAAVASEANNLHKQLALVLLPLLLLGGAPSYMAWIQSGKNRTPVPAAANFANISLSGVRRLPVAGGRTGAGLLRPNTPLAVVAATASLLIVGAGALAALRGTSEEGPLTSVEQSDIAESDGVLPSRADADMSKEHVRTYVGEEPGGVQASDTVHSHEYNLIVTEVPESETPSNGGSSESSSETPPESSTPPVPQPPAPVAEEEPPVFPTYRELTTVTMPLAGTITLSATPGSRVHILVSAQRMAALHEYITLDETGEFTYEFPEHRGKVVGITIEQTYDTADGPITPADAVVITSFSVPL